MPPALILELTSYCNDANFELNDIAFHGFLSALSFDIAQFPRFEFVDEVRPTRHSVPLISKYLCVLLFVIGKDQFSPKAKWGFRVAKYLTPKVRNDLVRHDAHKNAR